MTRDVVKKKEDIRNILIKKIKKLTIKYEVGKKNKRF